MSKRLKYLIGIVLFNVIVLIVPLDTTAQTDFIITNFTVEDGLSQNNVYAICQDSYGYVWIGTGRGLHRFNGNNMKSFYHERGNPQSLAEGYIRSIYEDYEGAIWIGTDNSGLSRYKNGKFKTFYADSIEGSISNDHVEQIIQMPDSSLYFATWGGGINIYKNGRFDHIRHDPNNSNSLPSDDVVDILYDEQSEILWVCTWGSGLCAIKNGEVTRYFNDPNSFNSPDPRTLAKTPDGSIWIGTWGEGLYRFVNDSFTHYDFSENDKYPIEVNKILDLTTDQDGNLWVGTFGGGIKFYNGHSFRSFYDNVYNVNAMLSNYIEVAFVDQQNNFWAGTYGGGLTKFEKTFFHTFKHDPGDEKSISDNFIHHILEMKDGSLWVGNRANGIDVFDGKTFTPIDEVKGELFDNLPVYTMTELSNGNIWFGGVNGSGLFIYSNNKIVEVSERFGIDFKKYHINTIFESTDHAVWIGASYDFGLVRIKGDSVTRFFHEPGNIHSLNENTVRSIDESKDGTIWIGTRRSGLNSYKDGIFNSYQSTAIDNSSISSNNISDLLVSNADQIWLATEQGLNRFDPISKKSKRFYKEDGLIDDFLKAIIEDSNGDIWIGADQGLIKINPESEQIWNFNINDGVSAYPFNLKSGYYGKSTGKLYFGGIRGLLAFHPDSINSSTKIQKVLFTDLLISNKSINIDSTAVINSRIEDADKVTIKRGFEKITIEFSDMQPDIRRNKHYSYYLEGYDENWQESEGLLNSASYTNLPAGQYLFQAKVTYDGSTWSDPASLQIVILPFWWESKWFISVLVLLSVGFIVMVFQWRNRYLISRSIELGEMVTEKTKEIEARNEEIIVQNEELTATIDKLKKTQKQLVQSEKMASLGMLSAGIAHEINNPMNFITGGVESLKMVLEKPNSSTESDGTIKKLIGVIQEGVQRTTKIVKSLGHFSRENDDWEEECDIKVIIDNCLIILQNDIKNRIEVSKKYDNNALLVKGNDGKLHQALLNIMTNAVQAIEGSGEIRIEVSKTNKWTEIMIVDNGPGILPENLSKINDPFFTTKSPGMGTGMGLFITLDIINQHGGKLSCKSIVQKGTEFRIKLPVIAG